MILNTLVVPITATEAYWYQTSPFPFESVQRRPAVSATVALNWLIAAVKTSMTDKTIVIWPRGPITAVSSALRPFRSGRSDLHLAINATEIRIHQSEQEGYAYRQLCTDRMLLYAYQVL